MPKLINIEYLESVLKRKDLKEENPALMGLLNGKCITDSCEDCFAVRAKAGDGFQCTITPPARDIKSLDNPVCAITDWCAAAAVDFALLMRDFDGFAEADKIINAISSYRSIK
ncbi:MAG: hypothetical protein ACLQF0_06820 [Dissulfurispiraceae bacterium]